jgi:hypothetical protein
VPLYQVTTNYFCCGIVVERDKTGRGFVTEAAPILHWTVGKSVDEIRDWLKKKKAKVVLVSEK